MKIQILDNERIYTLGKENIMNKNLVSRFHWYHKWITSGNFSARRKLWNQDQSLFAMIRRLRTLA